MNGLRAVLIGLALVLLAVLVRHEGRRGPQHAGPPIAQQAGGQASERPPAITAQAARDDLETAMKAAPQLSRAFEALRSQFPASADATLTDAARKLVSTGEKTSPDDLLTEGLRDLRQRSGVLAAKAGLAALDAVFDARSAIFDSLAQGDPQVCADYWFGGTSPKYADFAAGHRELEAQAASANIAATAEGRNAATDRAAPTDDDFKALEAALAAKGLSPDDIGLLLDGKSPDPPLPDARVCSDGRTYFQVLKGLSDEVRLRLYGAAVIAGARSCARSNRRRSHIARLSPIGHRPRVETMPP